MFKVGDLVNVKDHGIGTVEDVVISRLGAKVYIVQLKETKDLLKCLADDLFQVEDEDPTIIISRDEFVNVIKNIDVGSIVVKHFDDQMLGLTMAPILASIIAKYSIALIDELFKDKAENG